MRIYEETSLRSFKFWSGANDTVKHLTLEDLDTIETILEELYPEGVEDTFINDLFWFEKDTIAQWLGYDDFEELLKERKEEEGEE